jgi:Predicted nucleotide-binding protein containing TIR-like domain
MDKPRVFIGSSVEGLNIADAIFSQIRFETEPTIWKHGLFLPGKFSFEVLEEQLRSFDFAIMIASPDDKLEKRGERYETMRDNILIEFGLFAGVLGRKRTFLVLPAKQDINIPTDLLGIVPAFYDNIRIQKNPIEIEACVQETSRIILKAIKIETLEISKKFENDKAQIVESEKGKAIQSLYGVATKVRDIILVIQTDISDAFSNTDKYYQIKTRAVMAINSIYDDFKEPALKVGVESELLSLVDVSKFAVQDLPYPNELIIGEQEWRKKAINTGFEALNTFLKGGDPVNQIRNNAGNEFEARIENLKIKFREWWKKHHPEIQKATTLFQDKLFNESIKITLKRP